MRLLAMLQINVRGACCAICLDTLTSRLLISVHRNEIS